MKIFITVTSYTTQEKFPLSVYKIETIGKSKDNKGTVIFTRGEEGYHVSETEEAIIKLIENL